MLKLNRIVQKIERTIGTVLVGTILAVTLFNIVMRYFLKMPQGWTDETACFTLVWVTFLSLSYVFSNDRHVRFTSIQEKLSPRAASWIDILFNALIAAGMGILLPSGIRNMGFMVKSPSMHIPQQYIYVIVPIAYCLVIFHAVCHIIELAGGLRKLKKEA